MYIKTNLSLQHNFINFPRIKTGNCETSHFTVNFCLKLTLGGKTLGIHMTGF